MIAIILAIAIVALGGGIVTFYADRVSTEREAARADREAAEVERTWARDSVRVAERLSDRAETALTALESMAIDLRLIAVDKPSKPASTRTKTKGKK